MSTPIYVDSGGSGLEHSRYSPEHGISVTTPRQYSE
jgi:hypothetical protein